MHNTAPMGVTWSGNDKRPERPNVLFILACFLIGAGIAAALVLVVKAGT